MITTDANDVFGPPTTTDTELSRLRAALTERAENEDLLDVAYRTVDSPVGTLLLAATPLGLVRVAYASENHDAVLAKLAAQVSPRVLHAPARLDSAARELDEYFAGHRRSFDLPLDFQLSHGFRRAVHLHLREIGYGRTESYAEVAAATGSPAAVRAVGSACATNPLPVIVPCHRVVRSDGTLGGYVGGAEVKRGLLTMESSAGAGH
jgi:methylated-DNA-[protein]-cysteine S-methyltransferase